jgi:hypothetical protein
MILEPGSVIPAGAASICSTVIIDPGYNSTL